MPPAAVGAVPPAAVGAVPPAAGMLCRRQRGRCAAGSGDAVSLYRFVYYSAVIGGWAAMLAWFLAEVALLRGRWELGTVEVTLTAAVVGAAIGAGLNLVSAATGGLCRRQRGTLCRRQRGTLWAGSLGRTSAGFVGGGIGGAVGGLLGQWIVARDLPHALGWTTMGLAMGLAAGCAEGLYEQSKNKIRNGLIGGAVGGLLGGLLFDLIADPGSRTPIFNRAAAFVILGISVGALIGLTHVVLREAWLTVVDGFRPGRQLILSQTVTVLGRGDHLPLPFLGYAGRDLESEHLRITRTPNGDFVIEDSRSRLGTSLNGQPLAGVVGLRDGDLIKLGSNIVRFSLRRGSAERAAVPAGDDVPGSMGPTGPLAPPDGPAPSPIPPPPPSAQPASAPPPSALPPRAPPPPAPPASSPPPGVRPEQPPLKRSTAPPALDPRIPPPPPPPGQGGANR